MRLALLLLLMSCVASTQAEVPAAGPVLQSAVDFSLPGPCSFTSWRPKFTVPEELRSSLPATLSLRVNVPRCPPEGLALPFGSPFPVLFFANGFQNRASWYSRLVRQAAAWGLAVVQYTTPAFPIVSVAAEVQLFPHLAQWVADQNDDPASQLYGQVDPSRLVTGGHSRGGKLASLLLTGNPELVQAAYLVDPVDVTMWSPATPANPSAARALAASGRAVGMSAAGIIGSCNPADAGYQTMFAAAGNGSWLGIVPEAGHSQFSDAGCLINFAADRLCGKGKDGRREVAALTTTPMLAWFWDQLVGQQQAQQQAALYGGSAADGSPLPNFLRWVSQQEAGGKLEFEVKGGDLGDGLWQEAALPVPNGALEALQQEEGEEEKACAPELAAAGATTR